MTDYESIARLRLVHSTDRLERRFPERNRNIEALLYGAALVAVAIIGPWLLTWVFFALGL